MKLKEIRRVLVSDDIDKCCLDALRSNNIDVTFSPKMSKEQLLQEIETYDALIVRSATQVTKEVIEAGKQLKLIGRAGTGVDNIDVEAATKRSILVMNTPAGNARSAAELTCAMILCLARNVTAACASMKNGLWDRKLYMGTEVYDKTLAVIGLGRIGRDVANRMKAFGMEVIGYDPIVTAAQSKEFGIEWLPLESIWTKADYITVHVPLIPETENLLNNEVFDKCKRGVYVINCARGGIINESDLLTALNDGRCGGAALDVYVDEPPKSISQLIQHPKLVCTPHLGASTIEAQGRVAQEIADQIIKLNDHGKLLGVVNERDLAGRLPSN